MIRNRRDFRRVFFPLESLFIDNETFTGADYPDSISTEPLYPFRFATGLPHMTARVYCPYCCGSSYSFQRMN